MNPTYSDLPKITLRKTRDVDVVVNTITDPGHFYVTLSGKEFTLNDSKIRIEIWKIFPHKIHLSGLQGATCYLPPATKLRQRYVFDMCLWFCLRGGLRQTPPRTRHPPRPLGADPSDQRSACWEIRATSGRYASYWNAILYLVYCFSVKINLFFFCYFQNKWTI